MDNDVDGAPGCVELETYECMDVCKDASTDNWRNCLRDCHSIKASEISSFRNMAKYAANPTKSRHGNHANTIIVGGIIITLISLSALFYMQRKQK